ncbi:MAG: O-antigen ligase family protein, partial [Alphaproteobacteria bacterium]
IVLLVCFFLLIPATGLRPFSVPIGLGELMLLALIPASLRHANIKSWLCWTAPFLCYLAILVMSGLISGSLWTEPGLHDVLAGVFVLVAVSCFGLERVDLAIFCKWAIVGCLILYGLLVVVFTTESSDGIRLCCAYYNVRFTGFSINPNQLALMLLPLPFLAYWRYSVRPSGFGLPWLVVALLGIFTLGLLVGSNALLLGWVIGSVLLNVRRLPRVDFAALLLPVLLCLTWGGLPMFKGFEFVSDFGITRGAERARNAESARDAESARNAEITHDGGIRLNLLQDGLAVWMASPLIGNGPGPQVTFKGAPAEVHNTPIDVLSQTGVVGLACLAIFVIRLLKKQANAVRLSQVLLNPTALALLVSLAVFASAHFVLRQPVFWCSLMLAAAMARTPPPARI